ncbi:MAG: hypothetical protein HY815_23215 [Candidatus Riflebacteria bacterium]|nr:hypothetical protein [Candidatus Riflebacteria bacterium]
MLKEQFTGLAPLIGHWRGAGVNRDKEPFICQVGLTPALSGMFLRLVVVAQSGSAVVHAEETWVYPGGFGELEALQFTMQGGPRHLLVQQHPEGVVLSSPNPEAREEFRESVVLHYPNKDGAWRLIYSWGLPGETLSERSNARMIRDAL